MQENGKGMGKRNGKLRLDNRGLTLVELIAAVSIMAIVGAAVFGLMLTGSNFFNRENNNVKLQTQAQLFANQLNDLIVDTGVGISFFSTPDLNVGESSVLEVFSRNTDVNSESVGYVYYVAYSDTEQKAYYLKKNIVLDGTNSYKVEAFTDAEKTLTGNGSKWQLMASDVSSFYVDLSKLAAGKRLVDVNLGFTKGRSTYQMTQTVSLRNDILTGAALSQMYGSESATIIPIVKTVTVNTTVPAVVAGNSASFTATVFGVGKIDTSVKWSVEGASSAGTVIDAKTGKLTVGGDETATAIKVAATANGSPYPIGKLDVLIAKINDISITNSPDDTYIPGTTIDLKGAVNGNNLTEAMKKLTWSIDSVTSQKVARSDVTLSGTTLTLPVALAEGDQIIVRAAATEQTSKYKTLVITIGQTTIGKLKLWTDGTFTLNRGGSLPINAALEDSGLTSSVPIIWSIADYGGLSASQVAIDANGVVTATKDIPYKTSYTVKVKAEAGGKYLGLGNDGIIGVSIPAVSISFDPNSLTIARGSSGRTAYTLHGLEGSASSLDVTVSPALKSVIAYASDGRIIVSVSDKLSQTFTGFSIRVTLGSSNSISNSFTVTVTN